MSSQCFFHDKLSMLGWAIGLPIGLAIGTGLFMFVQFYAIPWVGELLDGDDASHAEVYTPPNRMLYLSDGVLYRVDLNTGDAELVMDLEERGYEAIWPDGTRRKNGFIPDGYVRGAELPGIVSIVPKKSVPKQPDGATY